MSLTDDLKALVGIKPRFQYVESELATAYGLAHDALKKIRGGKLSRGTHWDLVKGLVCYNDAGKAALELALGIKKPDAPADPAAAPSPATPPAPNSPPNNPPPGATDPKKFEAPKAGEIRTLVVVAIVRNRRILKARDQDRVAWVRVRNSAKFRVNMEVEARFVAGDSWELESRHPRFQGKY